MPAEPLWIPRAVDTVRLCLQIKGLPNAGSMIDELTAVSRRLAFNVVEVGTTAAADALTGDDARCWGEAVGYMFAAGVRRCIPKTVPTGELLTLRFGTNDFQFAAPPVIAGEMPLEKVWANKAFDAIAGILSVQATWASLRNFSLFQAAGPRSRQETLGRYTTSNLLFNAIQDMLAKESVFRAYEAAWASWNFGF